MSFSKIVAVAALVGSAMGHMVMNTPTPYGFKDLQTSPLNGENYLFPCQSGSRADAFDATGVNNPVSAGSTTPVKFTGSTTHGGGSCQFSVTYDYPPPSDPSKWKVIHTIIGGCPANTSGNLESVGVDADGRPNGKQCQGADDGTCVPTFDIPIPKQLKNGNATFAWTWFNHIGLREFYMNCAPITVSGGSDDDSFTDALPEMFVANYPGKCTTGQGILNIPNPGDSVQVLAAPSDGSTGDCPAADSVPSASSTAPAASSPAAYSSQAAVASSPVASAPAAAVSSPAAGVFAPGASSSASSAAATPTFPTVLSSAAAGTGAGAAAPTGSTSSDKVACSNEGAVVCMGTGYFGLCDHGFAVKMAVASGTKCENGQVTRRSLPRKHLHARIHGHHS